MQRKPAFRGLVRGHDMGQEQSFVVAIASETPSTKVEACDAGARAFVQCKRVATAQAT